MAADLPRPSLQEGRGGHEPPIPREMACPFCTHAGHGLDPCSCGCDDHTLLGIDTALGG